MMRILVGYNGSEASKAALADLRNAGLPAATHVLVICVAELWVQPRSVTEALEAAAEAKHFLNSRFPEWSVYTETTSGSPAREILARAETYKPDLIVLGEPRQQTEDGNIFLGQTSKAVLTQAECAVRIARGYDKTSKQAKRILVGFDGSAGAIRAVESIVDKSWEGDPEVRLLAVTDLGVLTSLDGPIEKGDVRAVDMSSASQWAQTIAHKALTLLQTAGIRASLETRLGRAKDAIIDEAEKWNADTIFVGPHASVNSFDRFLLGSVSASVAARAHCSVEVVRPATY
jgi:nucleotide-binding universal stress UspA family protein